MNHLPPVGQSTSRFYQGESTLRLMSVKGQMVCKFSLRGLGWGWDGVGGWC